MKNTAAFRQTVSRRRLLSAVGMAAAASILVSGCTASPEKANAGGDSDKDFVVYASLGLSGASSTFAPSLQEGMNAAVATINDNGGLLGRQMVLEVENNESVATTAVSNLQKRLKKDPAPELIWAGTTSSETLAMLSLTNREKVISLNNGSAPEIGDASKFPHSFSAGVTVAAQAEFLSRKLQEGGYKNVGVLTASGAFGEAQASQYRKTLEAAGLTVATETYEPDAVEMDGPLARLADSNPDVVVFNDFVHPSYVLKSRIKVGMGDVPFIGDVSTTIKDISGTVTEEEKKGVTLTTYSVQSTDVDRPGVDALLEQVRKAGHTINGGLYLYALAYDTLLAYANAVEATGTTDVDKVRAAMEAGDGETYQLAISDKIGWTKELHLGTNAEVFTVIPVVPMVAGQYKTTG